ncbi:MAG: glycosyltransferase family 2 protein [Paracoccaceae bacterium]
MKMMILAATPAPPLRLLTKKRQAAGAKTTPLIGQILLQNGDLSAGDLAKAIALQARENVRFGDILLANNMVSDTTLIQALASQFNCDIADLQSEPPDVRLIEHLKPENCLQHGFVPWKRVGGTTLIATHQPANFRALKQYLPLDFGQVLMVLAPEQNINTAIEVTCRQKLTERAETRVSEIDSCRNWDTGTVTRLVGCFLFLLATGLVLAPRLTLTILTAWAMLALIATTGLKAAAAMSTFRSARRSTANFVTRRTSAPAMRLSKVSVLVALYEEQEITERLIRRLKRLNYPRELLEICLIVEQHDSVTRAVLDATDLPRWMRQIVVPDAKLKTKPRALNYALDFCTGTIIGIYDAEDSPEPDQLYKVARRFHETDAKTACLQGVLDFYNSRENWLSRCFTIEYATWFRVLLPGLERLGFVIPLGGTTVFFPRAPLEEIGGWDAHNVTEDADIGIRLARAGYRTELIAALTEEEANCRLWPWIRQRSRWLKGYAITWTVHMRNPRKLLADLGLRRFLGFQLLFLGSLSQFLLAPLLWTFWALPLGLPHPLSTSLSPTVLYLMTVIFFASEIVTLAVGIFALAPSRHRGLWIWVPTLHLYFSLATIAGYKGLWELLSKPFYWDKTAHGQSDKPLCKGNRTNGTGQNISPANALRRA